MSLLAVCCDLYIHDEGSGAELLRLIDVESHSGITLIGSLRKTRRSKRMVLMALDTSEGHLRRLVIAKMMLVHGLQHAGLRDEASRMLSIHHFDWANEIILRLLADMSEQGHVEDGFNSILKSAAKAYHAKTGRAVLPDQNEILELHKVRNRIQHGATIVDLGTVDRFRQVTENFISTVVSTVFHKTLAQVSLASLILDEKLTAEVQLAEQRFNGGDFRRCIEACEEALTTAAFDTGEIVGKAGMLTRYMGAKSIGKMLDKETFLRKYRGSSKKLAEDFREAIIELGRVTTTMQFFDIYRGAFLDHQDTMASLDKLNQDELRQRALSSLDFVTNLILKWQAEGILRSASSRGLTGRQKPSRR